MTYDHLRRWTMPDHYFGATWPDYYSAGVGQSDASDALERSNFECMLRELGGESETVIVVEESHWAVGWVQWIAIHESDAAALTVADRIKGELEDYPVVDEEHWSDLEWNEAADFWDSLSPRARVQEAMHVRQSYPWLASEPVWHLGRLTYGELANYGTTISEALCERIRCG